MKFENKVRYLEKILDKKPANYAEEFYEDIYDFLYDFTPSNPQMKFLENLNSKKEILQWVEKIASRLVLKSQPESPNNVMRMIENYYYSG